MRNNISDIEEEEEMKYVQEEEENKIGWGTTGKREKYH